MKPDTAIVQANVALALAAAAFVLVFFIKTNIRIRYRIPLAVIAGAAGYVVVALNKQLVNCTASSASGRWWYEHAGLLVVTLLVVVFPIALGLQRRDERRSVADHVGRLRRSHASLRVHR